MLRGGAATDAVTTRGSPVPGSPGSASGGRIGRAQREHGERRHDGRLREGDGDVAASGFFGPEAEDETPGLVRRGRQRRRDHRQRAVGEREAAQLDAHLDLAGGVEPRGGLLTRRAGGRDEIFPRQPHDGVELDAHDEAGGDLRVDERRYGRCAVEPTSRGARRRRGACRRGRGCGRSRGTRRRRGCRRRGRGSEPGRACAGEPSTTERATAERAGAEHVIGHEEAAARLPRPTRRRRPCPCRRRRRSPRATASRSRSRSPRPSGAAPRQAPPRCRSHGGRRRAAPRRMSSAESSRATTAA